MKKLVVHAAEAELSEESGMGRIALQWKKALEDRGYDFVHIGPKEVEQMPRRGYLTLFPYLAYRAYLRLGRAASVFLVHEPSARPFLNKGVPAVLFSHGLERRWWLQASAEARWRTKLIYPLTRLRDCDLGCRKASKLLLTNSEDFQFIQDYYKRKTEDIFLFRNGVYPTRIDENAQPASQTTVLFVGTWIERKGVRILVKSAEILRNRGLNLKWILAGTGGEKEKVLKDWPPTLHQSIDVIPHFMRESEESIIARSNVFVLPSFYEGQPLALLQAMAAGRCCITTDCCGQRDLIKHGVSGLLHKPGDAKQLASLIEQCAIDGVLRLRLGRNARLSVKDRDWQAVSSEIVDKVEEILRE